jgi:hypothetical protein
LELQALATAMEQACDASCAFHTALISKVAFRSEVGLELKVTIRMESNIFDIPIRAKPLSFRYDLNSIANMPKPQPPVKLLGILVRR